MKGFRCAWLLVCATLLPVCGAGCASAVAVATVPATRAVATKTGSASTLPKDVDVYATVDLAGGWRCKVGAKLTGDLLQEHPVVYLVNPDGEFAWHTRLRIPAHFYQGRATHCVASGNRVYVLVQIDTDSRRSLNETVLRLVELDRDTGKRVRSKQIDVPHLSASPYTSWVDKGDEHFTLKSGELVIKGKYELMSEWNSASGEPQPFVAKVPLDLHR